MKTYSIIVSDFNGQRSVYFGTDREYAEELLEFLQLNADSDEVFSMLED